MEDRWGGRMYEIQSGYGHTDRMADIQTYVKKTYWEYGTNRSSMIVLPKHTSDRPWGRTSDIHP